MVTNTTPSMAIRLAFESIRSIAAASIAATYTAVGSATEHPARLFIVNNLTDGDLMFSFDGVNDHFVMARRSEKVIDVMNNSSREGGFFLPKGRTLYVKEIENPTTGSVYFSVLYGEIL